MSFFSKRKKVKKEKTPSCSAVIAAAGSSQRMNGEDKLFVEINDIPVIVHTLAAFQSCECINEIVIVCRSELMELVCDICRHYNITKAAKVVTGGPTRSSSVYNGVFAVSDTAGLIAIHDGARPCVEQDLIKRTIDSASKFHAAAPAVPVRSTIKRVKDNYVMETVDRDDLFEIQTPQVFTAELIKAALTNAINNSFDVTDDCKAVELIGAPVYITEGSHSNIKITTKEDVTIAKAILTQLGVRG